MPPGVVTGPPLVAPRFGLIVAARDGLAANPAERWTQGFGWEPTSCGAAGVVDRCDTAADLLTLDEDDGAAAAAFTPFGVWAGYQCSTFGPEATERETRARNLLDVLQHRAVEHEFWTGDAAATENWDNDFLANTATVTRLSGSGESSPLVYGLAALEEALYGCGGRGMIHCTVQTATLWYAAQAIRREGTLLLTALDTIVVPGSGYDGSSPDGTVDATGDVAWAYATGMVDVRLGPVTVTGAELTDINRQTNLWETRAQRLAAATFDPCCHFGVAVDLCSTFCVPAA